MLRDEVSTGDKQLYDENTSDKDDTETLNMLGIKYHKKVTADSKPNMKKDSMSFSEVQITKNKPDEGINRMKGIMKSSKKENLVERKKKDFDLSVSCSKTGKYLILVVVATLSQLIVLILFICKALKKKVHSTFINNLFY